MKRYGMVIGVRAEKLDEYKELHAAVWPDVLKMIKQWPHPELLDHVATAHGAGVWRGNVVYLFSNTGAFLTTSIYCLRLHARHRTIRELIELPAGVEKASLPLNWTMAVVTGLFWYGQFFFYNLGHVRMGHYRFTSWAIHMIMLVLISNFVGILLREWRQCRRLTLQTITLAFIVLVAAVLALTYGNYLGG